MNEELLLRTENRDRLIAAVIAKAGEHGMHGSGYVVVRVDDWCAIGRYDYGSMYSTWTALSNGGGNEQLNKPKWTWCGTYQELIDIASRKADPFMPEREASPKDFDYEYLMACYEKVLKDASAGG